MRKLEIQKRLEYKNNHEVYARDWHKIRTKKGEIKPLLFNSAQKYIDKEIQSQINEIGKVRVLILKGRQQGCSTLISSRFYWRVTHRRGAKAFILAHREDASVNLYDIVKRYHDNMPNSLRPHVGASNAKRLHFDKLDSGYAIGTSGGGEIGRSDTIQYFHGSEVAFWDNTDKLSAGILQTIPDAENTEIVLESTANGIGNMFHSMCLDALSGKNEYKLIFVPWFWQEEYRLKTKPDFSFTTEERELVNTFKLDAEQIMWRRNKISTLDGKERQFKQEYPCTITEAFQFSSDNAVLTPEIINHCLDFKAVNYLRFIPVLGVDVARGQTDKSIIIVRRGSKILCIRKFFGLDGEQLAREVIKVYRDFNAGYIFVDATGVGASPIDFLKSLGYAKQTISVYVGKKASDPIRFANKRAESWFRMRDAMAEGLEIPDDPELLLQLQSQQYDYQLQGSIKLMSKKEMKAKGIPSPDIADAISLTYAELFNTLISDSTARSVRIVNNNNNKLYRHGGHTHRPV